MGTSGLGPELAQHTCARRLAPAGAGPDPEIALSWYGGGGPAGETLGSEVVVQAVSGLMAVHGRDAGRPRRMGLEVASVAAGILAAHAVLAGRIGALRGRPVAGVEVSVLAAGLLLGSHRVAAATTGQEWVPAPPGPDPGPPFTSRDGVWFEIETLDPEQWRAFWVRLGAGRADLGWAWKLFRSRFFRGTATLPPGLHATVRRLDFEEVAGAAAACGVSLCRVRGYPEALADLGPLPGHPELGALAAAAEAHPAAPLRRVPIVERAELPLAGIRLVEATSRLQGPLAGLLLRWLGAEVVRVEPPGGDPARGVAPLAGDTGSFFLCFNRGKEPVELDLGRPGGRDALRDLVAGADAFLHNWRPGKAEEWGLDATSLAAVNPHLVHAAASGWGPGDDGSRVGTDFLVQAHSGLAAGLTPLGRPPAPSRALLTDYFGALVTAEALLAGLLRRERTGRGARVSSSLLAGAMSLQAHVTAALEAGEEHGRRHHGRPVWGVLDHPVEAADRLLAVDVERPGAFERLCLGAGVDPARPGAEHEAAARLAAEPAAHWEAALGAAGVPAAAVCTDLAGLPADPRLAERFETLAGTCRAPGPPWRLIPERAPAVAGATRASVQGGGA